MGIGRLEIPTNQEILAAVAGMDELRGRWIADRRLPAERLSRIAEAAEIQSVAASCRLSGIRVSDLEVAGLLQGDAIPPRDAPEILSYAAGLRCELSGDGGLLTAAALQQLHALVSGSGQPSVWRTRPHQREAFSAEGQATGRVFSALPAHLIDAKVEELLTWLEFELRARERHPVLAIGTFVLGFLLASPFETCNARVARLLFRHLLVRAGYGYIPYASLEREIEELRERYYQAYDEAQRQFWRGEAELTPWLTFLCEVLARHRERVEKKLERERTSLEFPPLQRAILDAVAEHGTVDAALLIQTTGANRNTLKDNLRRLVDRGLLEKTGQRRGTRYRLATGDELRSGIPEVGIGSQN